MHKPTLLYVEDDLDVLNDITFLLKDYFSNIYTAKDGKQALSHYAQYKPDIILLDINIPFISGIEVAKEIRITDTETPILFLSAYSDKDKLVDAINLGTSSYLVKPIKIKELTDAIDKIIKKIEPRDDSAIELSNGYVWNSLDKTICFNKKIMRVTKKESLLLALLDKNRLNFLTACAIATNLSIATSKDEKCNNMVQLLSRFKKKILKNFKCKAFFIQNIYGMGYKII